MALRLGEQPALLDGSTGDTILREEWHDINVSAHRFVAEERHRVLRADRTF